MDETMNTGVEVTTEVSGAEEVTQEVTIEETSGPSKGFVAAVVGGVAALAVGAFVAVRRHRKKKVAAQEDVIVEDDDFCEDEDEEDPVDVNAEEIPAKEEKSEEKPAEKK